LVELVSGNIYIRKNGGMKAGQKVQGHTHNFDHTTIVFTGAAHVKAKTPDGRVIEQDFKAPTHFLVKAEVTHEITALEDGTEFWCVYSHRTPQGDVIQDHIGWTKAYG
jgi:quercetin dioxygenase-like cupin family protein